MTITHIHSGNFPETDQKLLSDFIELYNLGFADADERTNPDEWITILSDTSENKKLDTHIFVSYEGKASKKVTGGIVLEYYPKSQSILLAYIIVDANLRKSGLGRKLFNKTLELISFLKLQNKETGLVVAEIAIPWKVDRNISPIPPEIRVEVFRGLGAKWIDIAYAQPPLGPGKSYVDHSFLICFPELTPGSNISEVIIKDFLNELYIALGIPEPQNDKYYSVMMKDIDEKSEIIRELPVFEDPKLKISDVAISLHAVKDSFHEVDNDEKAKASCLNFKSFEYDMLNHQNVKKPPFYSRCMLDKPRTVRVIFPEMITYSSEGRVITLYPENTEIRVLVHLHFTHYIDSNCRIWHLCILPEPDSSIDEYAIIKLLKLAHTGIQEEFDAVNHIRFALSEDPDEQKLSIQGLFNVLSGGSCPLDSKIKTCSVELTLPVSEEIDIEDFYEKYNGAMQGIPESEKELGKMYKNTDQPQYEYLIQTLCGITSGIFDFRRFSYTEAMDVMRPLYTEVDGTVIILHKNNLFSISDYDECLEDFREQFGINPYFLISHSAIIYNEEMLDQADNLIKMSLEVDGNTMKSDTIKVLENNRQRADKYLNNYYRKEGFFHYPYEKTLFLRGAVVRGLPLLFNHLRTRLHELSYKIEEINNNIRKRNEKRIGILLLILSALQVYFVIDSFCRDYSLVIPAMLTPRSGDADPPCEEFSLLKNIEIVQYYFFFLNDSPFRSILTA